MSSDSTENQEQPKGIPVELVVKKLDEKKVYPIRLDFIPKEGDAIELGDVAYKVGNVKYKESDGSFMPVIELVEK
jgi:hypothetical protein